MERLRWIEYISFLILIYIFVVVLGQSKDDGSDAIVREFVLSCSVNNGLVSNVSINESDMDMSCWKPKRCKDKVCDYEMVNAKIVRYKGRWLTEVE